MLRTPLLLSIVSAWLAGGLYIGASGLVGSKALQSTVIIHPVTTAQSNAPAYVEFEGLQFKDEKNLREFMQERTYRWFAWVFELPQILSPVIACIGFGLFGGAGRILREMTLGKARRGLLDSITYPLLGAVIGVFIAFVSVALPNVLVTGDTSLRPEMLLVLSLAGGLFAEDVYPWIGTNVVSTLFTSKHKEPSSSSATRRR